MMKTKILFLTIAALFAAACASNSEIDDLQSQIDKMNSERISSVETQIAGIQSSITSMEQTDAELQTYIKTLQSEKEQLEQISEGLRKSISELETRLSGDISAAEANALAQLNAYKTAVDGHLASIESSLSDLTAQDAALQTQIDNLKKYVDTGIKETKDWASATFATLEQYQATAGIVASIQTQIASINTAMEELKKNGGGVSRTELDEAISGLDVSLQEKIKKVADDAGAALSQAADAITAAYTTAIHDAISSSETSMKSWVNGQLSGYYTIAQTDAKIASLKNSLEGQLNSQKTYLEGLISNLETNLANKIKANKSLIDNLDARVSGLDSDLSGLAKTVSANASNISANASEIAANARAIATNASDIDACERLIAANKRLIDDNASAISTNASAISALQSRAAADEQSISQNAKDIAKNAEDIAANAALISANAKAIGNNARAISDNAADIAQLRKDLSTARTEITEAYQQAIGAAIATLDGQLRGEIATQVNTINTRITDEVAAINATIEALTARVTQCEKDIKSIKNTIYSMQQDIEHLQDQVSAILARIQSIAFVPAYSDGKVPVSYTDNGKLTPGTATLDFELQPASTAAELAGVWQTALKMKAVYTISKAPTVVQLEITSATAENGYLSVTVSGSALKEDFFRSRCSANAALVVSDGNNELASEYVPLVPWTTDVISFGDANFKAYCVENFDSNGDGELTEDEAKAVTSVNASMLNITSLVGIEYFSNLESIDVSFNKLETLDLSHSPKLTEVLVNGNKLQALNLSGLAGIGTLDCSNNKLTALNVSEAEGLQSLNCTNNSIGALNLKKNKALVELQCSGNQLTALDLKNNTSLVTLYCRKNGIGVLDLASLTALKNLDCGSNSLQTLNVYKNTALETLYCGGNALTSLSVSANPALLVLDCSGNALTSLDVSRNVLLETLNCSNNALTSLDVSGNAALESVNCQGNTAQTRLWVKDAAQQSALTIRKEDATVIAFNNGGIQIPDANLKAYLLALFDDDEDGEISVAEADNVVNVNCSGKSIADLTGLEACPNLKYLNFADNQVSAALLPNLTKLETVVAYGNPIERLNIDNDAALDALYRLIAKHPWIIFS